MSTPAVQDKDRFWIEVMQHLNAADDLYHHVPQVLKDTCTFFDFGCGFIYQTNYAGTFFLREIYVLYPNSHLADPLDLDASLGQDSARQLVRQRSVIYVSENDAYSQNMPYGSSFAANALVLVPVTDADHRLVALVGMADRRRNSRRTERDMDFVCAILNTVANHVKLMLYQAQTNQTKGALQSIVDNLGSDICVNDFYTHEVLYVNHSMAALHGGAAGVVGKKCWQALCGKTRPCKHCPQPQLIDEQGRSAAPVHWEHQRSTDGAWYRMTSSAFRWVDGRLAHVVSCQNITENKRNEMMVRHMADFDALTGLKNRRRLLEDMDTAIYQMQKAGRHGYVLFIDLNGFKAINDSLGHKAGDDILRQVGRMLRSNPCIRQHAYRHGGDEFVVFLDSCNGKLADILCYLQQAFSAGWVLGDFPVQCGASIGITRYPDDGESTEALLDGADAAMYAAKQHGAQHTWQYNCGSPTPIPMPQHRLSGS